MLVIKDLAAQSVERHLLPLVSCGCMKESTLEINHTAVLNVTKLFKTSSSLKTHERTHTDEMPFRCSICDKKFRDSGNMRKHEGIHTNEKPHCCSKCERTFNTLGELLIQERLHTGEKPYSCSKCDKMFKSSRSLMSHERVHSDEKPFKCSICDRKFRNPSNMRKHQKNHSRGIQHSLNEDNLKSKMDIRMLPSKQKHLKSTVCCINVV